MTESIFTIDQFVNVRPGDPYRLLPFGTLVKNGKRREVTPELAARFRLPHFKPPIKLGSHDDTTPAGGSIIGLEVRSDGLYAVPEFTDRGASLLNDGAYRYHSPEIIWEGELENPADGSAIAGPLIVGDALLHTPHLGEAAALYTIEIRQEGEHTMADQENYETVQAPRSFWDRLFGGKPKADEPEHAEQPAPVIPEEYTAAMKERDDLASKLAEIEKAQALKARVDTFAAALKETKLDGIAGAPDMLASMNDEQAAWVVQQVKALSAQAAIAEDVLTTEQGSNGAGAANPIDALGAAINAKMSELKITFGDAYSIVKKENPDLFAAAYGRKE